MSGASDVLLVLDDIAAKDGMGGYPEAEQIAAFEELRAQPTNPSRESARVVTK